MDCTLGRSFRFDRRSAGLRSRRFAESAGLARRTFPAHAATIAILFIERNAMLGGIPHDMKTFIQCLKTCDGST